MIRTGIIGTLNNLENTIENIRSFPEYFLTGFYTRDHIVHNPCRKSTTVNYFSSPEELISVSEVIIISDRPGDFENIIHKVLKNSKHLLIFPDTSLSYNQLETFIKLAEEAGVFLFLFNEDIKTRLPEIIKKYFGRPEFIDIYRSIDQSVLTSQRSIFETFYKELFLVMKLNPLNPRKYLTTTIPYFSPEPNLLNIRIEFENGTSANVTINKFAGKNERRVEIFRHDRMALIYPETGEIKIIRKDPDKTEVFTHSDGQKIDSQKEGLSLFLNYIISGNFTSDPYDTGIAAHRTAIEIIHQLIPVTEKSCL
jgi:hypothetical protein